MTRMQDHPFIPDGRDPRYCGHWTSTSRSSEAGTLTFGAQCGYPPDTHPAPSGPTAPLAGDLADN